MPNQSIHLHIYSNMYTYISKSHNICLVWKFLLTNNNKYLLKRHFIIFMSVYCTHAYCVHVYAHVFRSCHSKWLLRICLNFLKHTNTHPHTNECSSIYVALTSCYSRELAKLLCTKTKNSMYMYMQICVVLSWQFFFGHFHFIIFGYKHALLLSRYEQMLHTFRRLQ